MKIVVCDNVIPGIELERRVLGGLPGVELVDARCASKEDVVAACAGADAVLNRYNTLSADVIGALSGCRVIATYGIGLDRIDVEAATEHGILVCNSPDYNKSEVADHAAAMILALSRNLMGYDRGVRGGAAWSPGERPLRRLYTQTAGFVGFGNIGRQIAGKLQTAFGMRILFHDPLVGEAQARELGAEKADLDALLRESDYISVNCALTAQTRHLIDERGFAAMKPTACIVNCARGGIVKESALIAALKTGAIAGAALDTFEREPLPADHPLLELDNVILSPHVAWYTAEAEQDVTRVAAEQVKLALTGGRPGHCVNYEPALARRNAV